MLVDMQELLTYEDVARITKFKISTLRKWVQLRKMPFSKINGAIRFNAGAVREWMEGKVCGERSVAPVSVDRTGDLFSEARGAKR
jgi:excisionase family DNA binding protein